MERASGIARHAHEPTESAVPGKPAAPSTDHARSGAVPPGTFAALAVPNFRRYVSGQALSLIGTWVETVAQALLVLKLTHSGTILGLTTAARYAPILLLSPYAGLLVDRYSKRHVLLVTQIGLGLVSAALGVSVLSGGIRLWQVVVLALAFGTLSAVDNPARQAFVPEVVGRDLVRNAVTLNTTLVNVARVIGPTIAAVLASTIGLGWCFVVNAVSFGFVIASLLSLDTRRLHPVPPVPRGRGELRAGLRYAARVPEIARPLLMMALIGTFTFEFEVSLPLLAEKDFPRRRHQLQLADRRPGRRGGRGRPVRGPVRPDRSGPPDHGRAGLRDRRRPGGGRSHLPDRGRRVRSGRRGHSHVPHHRELHHPARLRARLPRPDHRAVVDGTGRQHSDRRTDHRRGVPSRRAAAGARPRGRRLPRRRDRRPLARQWPQPPDRLDGNNSSH
jgi:Transmembrane secretion effector